MSDRMRGNSGDGKAEQPVSLASGLAQIRGADAAFDEKQFVQGVGGAFEIIIRGYADGDTAMLRPLLSADVYDGFAQEIRRRVGAGEKHQTHIERIKDIDLLEAGINGGTATITVRIISDQGNVTLDANGVVVDGDRDRLSEVVDIWTFTRNTRARDPNWVLAATRTES